MFANQDFIANIYYHGTPVGGFFIGIHRQYSNEYDRWVTWSFSQPFYAYKWFPCKQIHSDKIDSVHMVLRTDSTLTAVSSGRLHEKTPLDNGMVMFDWRTKYAISYNMIFFAVSEYMLYDFYVQPQGYDDSILITHYVYNQDYLADFKSVLEETTGKDFTSFFDQWYYGEGYPVLDISWEQDNGMLHLYSRESSTCDTTSLFNFTMDYQLVFAGGDSIIRLYQSDTLNQYTIPIPRPILEIIPDPNKWILAKTYIGHVSIKENPLPFAMEIFPNPCSNSARLLITGHALRVTNIDLYSISGKKIRRAFEGEIGPGAYEEVLDVNDLPAGVYFIRLQAGSEIAVRKFIVTK